MNAQKPPARKVFIFYWRSAKHSYWYNAFVPEMVKLIEQYDIETIRRLRGFDFRFLNINRSAGGNMDYRQYAGLIDSYRPKKLRRFPLVVIDEGADYQVVNSSYALKQFENLLSEIYDYHFPASTN